MTTKGSPDDEMRRYCAQRAAHYRDDEATPDVQLILDRYAEFMCDRLPGRSVLEVACGTGYWTQWIAGVADRMLATDASTEMLTEARAREYPQNNVTFAVADAYELQDVEPGWDAAFHFQWFSHVPTRLREPFLHNLHARLDPGSLVVFGDNCDAGDGPDAGGDRFQQRELPDGSTYRVIKNWPTETELRSLLEPATNSFTYTRFDRDWFVTYTLR